MNKDFLGVNLTDAEKRWLLHIIGDKQTVEFDVNHLKEKLEFKDKNFLEINFDDCEKRILIELLERERCNSSFQETRDFPSEILYRAECEIIKVQLKLITDTPKLCIFRYQIDILLKLIDEIIVKESDTSTIRFYVEHCKMIQDKLKKTIAAAAFVGSSQKPLNMYETTLKETNWYLKPKAGDKINIITPDGMRYDFYINENGIKYKKASIAPYLEKISPNIYLSKEEIDVVLADLKVQLCTRCALIPEDISAIELLKQIINKLENINENNGAN